MTLHDLPALLLIVAAMLAPYGISAALTHFFPKLARSYRDTRLRLP
jgi:hypothetical protein